MEKWMLLTWLAVGLTVMSVSASTPAEDEVKLLPVRFEKSSSKRHTEDVLRHMGLARVKSPAGHRKRVAGSRPRLDKATPPDSHVFVIKLPPNKFYYEKHPAQASGSLHRRLNRLPVDFKSNGKPGKIYHWNLPLVEKMNSKKANQVLKWAREEKMAEGRRVSYYKPKKPAKQAFHKYFPGNGKPHSLYVIERSHHKTKH